MAYDKQIEDYEGIFGVEPLPTTTSIQPSSTEIGTTTGITPIIDTLPPPPTTDTNTIGDTVGTTIDTTVTAPVEPITTAKQDLTASGIDWSMIPHLSSGGSLSSTATPAQMEGVRKYQEAISQKYGMSYEDWLKTKEKPLSPMQQAERLVGTGMGDNMDKGDQGYQMEELATYYRSPAGQAEMQKYWAENPTWFFPDGSHKFQYQEDIDAWNYGVQEGRHGFTPLTEAQKQDAIAKGLNPDGMFDMDAARRAYQDPDVPHVLPPEVPTTPTDSTGAGGTGSTIGGAVGDAVGGLVDEARNMATNPELAPGTAFQYTPQQLADNEFMTQQGKLLGEGAYASKDGLTLQAAQWAEVGMPNVALIGNTPELNVIRGQISDGSFIQDVPVEVSQRFIEAEAAQRQMLQDFQVFKGSTVKEQFAMLQDDWIGQNGENKVPFYAQGAITAAKQQYAARGMPISSMGAAAITQAGMESMIPAAMADAQFWQSMSLKSFDAHTAVGMAKLSHIANLDMAQLNHRQSMAVDSANKFFQMDMSNVDNERLTAATNMANRVQAMFSDAAATNVANNLGYTTGAEMRRFYDNLSLQAQEASARMLLDANKFNASVANSRTEFNAQMSFEIERDNINYLRAVNTQNTAGINQQNMVNSQNLLGISNTALANALTMERDQLHRIFEASENAADRASNYAIAELTANAHMERLTAAQQHESAQNLGGFLSDVGSTLIGNIFGGGSNYSSITGREYGEGSLADLASDISDATGIR